MASITIRGLSKKYPARRGQRADAPAALNEFDLDVADGELLVLVGPSGCGKSTVLRLIAGLEEPTAGSIQLGEVALAGVSPQARDVAMVFQGYALYPHLTVRENIGFALKMRGLAKAPRAQRVSEIAEMVGLSALLDRLPNELSGGERQRVAMGRAIVRSPKAFLFDEPLSNLDAKLRAELRVELVALVRRLRATAIYVTHDQAEAMTMGDRVAVMHGGVLQQLGTPREIYQRPVNTFVAGFLGTPAMNLLDVRDGRACGLGMPVPAGLRQQGPLTMGVRPEHIVLQPQGGGTIDFEARVTATEPLGAETYVYLDGAGTALRCRAPGMVDIAAGTTLRVGLHAGALLWFDGTSGALLSTGALA